MLHPQRWMIVGFLAVLIVILSLAGALRPAGDVARRVFLPAVRVVAAASDALGKIVGSHDDRRLVERVKELETRSALIAVDYVRLRALEEENRALRAQAKFLQTSGYDSVGARVISRDVKNRRALLLIDRGKQDQVEAGEAVVANEGIFLGKINQIKDRIATVELFTDPQSRVAAAVSGSRTLIGIVEGRGNGTAMLTYVPASEGLARDMLIVTAGTEEKVPAHLPLGVVNSIEGKPTDPFVNAYIEPLIPIERVSLVSVLRPSALRPSL